MNGFTVYDPKKEESTQQMILRGPILDTHTDSSIGILNTWGQSDRFTAPERGSVSLREFNTYYENDKYGSFRGPTINVKGISDSPSMDLDTAYEAPRFSQRFYSQEGFEDSDEINRCVVDGKATKECILSTAEAIGFKSSGAFWKFINSGGKDTDGTLDEYVKLLKNDKVFPYKTILNGNIRINELNLILNRATRDLFNPDERIRKAIKDIMDDAGSFLRTNSLCDWMKGPDANETIITKEMEPCLLAYFRENGGDTRGTSAPKPKEWLGKKIKNFKASVTSRSEDAVLSNNVDVQSVALAEKYGVNINGQTTGIQVKAAAQDCMYERKVKNDDKCRVTCQKTGEALTRTIEYKVVRRALAGGSCKIETGENIPSSGILLKEEPCVGLRPCLPQSCEGSWITTKTCSKPCGGGEEEQTFTITKPARDYGRECVDSGRVMQGGEKRTMPCNTDACIPINCDFEKDIANSVDCPTGADAIKKCGTEVYSVTKYKVKNQPQYGGTPCPDPPEVRAKCMSVPAVCPGPDPQALDPDSIAVYYNTDYKPRTGFPDYTLLNSRISMGVNELQLAGIRIGGMRSIRIGSNIDSVFLIAEDPPKLNSPMLQIRTDTPSLGTMNDSAKFIKIKYKSYRDVPLDTTRFNLEYLVFPSDFLPTYGRAVIDATGSAGFFRLKIADVFSCGCVGRPSSDNRLRLYTRQECEGSMESAIWHGNGECTNGVVGGSYSAACAALNNDDTCKNTSSQKTKDTTKSIFQQVQDAMKSGIRVNIQIIRKESADIWGFTLSKLEQNSDKTWTLESNTYQRSTNIFNVYDTIVLSIPNVRARPQISGGDSLETIFAGAGKCGPRQLIGRFRLANIQNDRAEDIYNGQTAWANDKKGWIFLVNPSLDGRSWRESVERNANEAQIKVPITRRDLNNNDWVARINAFADANNVPIERTNEGGPPTSFNQLRPIPYWGPGGGGGDAPDNQASSFAPFGGIWTGNAFCYFLELADQSQPSSTLFLQRGGKPRDYGYGDNVFLQGTNINGDGSGIRWWKNTNRGDPRPLLHFFGGSEGQPQWGAVYNLYCAVWMPQ